MTDLACAKAALAGHTLALCRAGECRVSDGRGIAPMMELIAEGVDLAGCSAADVVVGKAAAMLFAKCRIAAVYAGTLSRHAQRYLDAAGIPYEYGALTEYIVNREGTGMCPMEQTVLSEEDAERGYLLLRDKLAALHK